MCAEHIACGLRDTHGKGIAGYLPDGSILAHLCGSDTLAWQWVGFCQRADALRGAAKSRGHAWQWIGGASEPMQCNACWSMTSASQIWPQHLRFHPWIGCQLRPLFKMSIGTIKALLY